MRAGALGAHFAEHLQSHPLRQAAGAAGKSRQGKALEDKACRRGLQETTRCLPANWQSLVQGGFLADSLQFIPYSEGKRFELSADVKIGKSGRQMPVMECGANYADYLSDLDADQTAGLIEEANNSGRYPGLKIGDILTPNNNAGNWE